ncbi:hypothetical protein FOXG_21354 [Fusarium oxysporum f. sp. lycopersici 4287]|uniref:Uncharacterized protein n=1 Tax=Fusarium oxysporum f. sp. lycopersici (strain 4287 / CBS 123668 / FGSC 9935 / NRRL 34936) TaxID=426428 RepID=A0A0J9VWZ8_FUSO4|nr:hypothetical protein FOXG_20954 [Fusarium oxysporum f. sp. lycopersici 4287]XP_018253554.1 hypothetical protein FOXG_21354 [Fusarium oxysporum f. sp. lycopersici 4287]EWZ79267.1 hypothetical protein FOWG_16553 [Fusarium oxysporum f. sp. lycopersici MN25]KNB13851.1 hypothetical protein FOXG_20954 [Fusarium oxysporum f. sp. lycopersici 4287]KNB15509.1 hypothetical protein FOXG_21354 [Fusarium oxysporum f. sp. lycopersici 4287]
MASRSKLAYFSVAYRPLHALEADYGAFPTGS